MSNSRFVTSVLNALLLAPLAMVSAAHAVTFNVNSTLDQPDDLSMVGTCHTASATCTLRAAVMQANRTSGAGATIMLPAGTYFLTIPAAAGDDETNGDLNLTTPLSGNPTISIVGAGADVTFIDANKLDRIFSVATGRTVSITGVTLQHGYIATASIPANDGGAILNRGTLSISHSTLANNQIDISSAAQIVGGGGGISNLGALTLDHVTMTGNLATVLAGPIATADHRHSRVTTKAANGASVSYGGSLANLGNATVTNSVVSHSTALQGGGIYSQGAAISIANTTFDSNNATYFGGGLALFTSTGVSTIRSSTVSNNGTQGDGGGILNNGPLYISSSTISANNADNNGGGLYNNGNSATVYSSSFIYNGADADGDLNGDGGGIYNILGAQVNLFNSLIAINSRDNVPIYDECFGTVISYTRNLFGPDAACTILIGSGSWGVINDFSKVGPLRDNGGPTLTHALLAGNNAIDGSDPAISCFDYAGELTTDQRGFPRVSGARCDIGAFEYALPSLDVDGNGAYDPLSDGLLIVRYLLGMTSSDLITNALGPGAKRLTAAAVINYLTDITPNLDVDGNTQTAALTDGVLILRYLFGLRDNALSANAVGGGASRTVPQIQTYIQSLMP